MGQKIWKTHIDTQRKRNRLYSGRLEVITINIVEYVLLLFFCVNDFIFTLDSQTRACTDSIKDKYGLDSHKNTLCRLL